MDRTPVLLADDHTLVRAGLRNALDGLPEIEITGEVGNGCEFHRRAFLDKKDLDTASLRQVVEDALRWRSGIEDR